LALDVTKARNNKASLDTIIIYQIKSKKTVRIHTRLRIIIRKTFLLDRNQVDTISKGIFQHIYCAFISLLKSFIIKNQTHKIKNE
jgi:hypothetical protein